MPIHVLWKYINHRHMTTDSNGATLQDGDSVFLTKDLKVKGSSMGLKRGDVFKKIRVTDNPEEIECKQGRSTIVLKTCFVKKKK